jgi:hypothetical protein
MYHLVRIAKFPQLPWAQTEECILGLELVELVDLFAHLGDGIVVLLAQAGESALMLDVGLLQVAAELGELSLAFLVELNLGRGGTASLLQTLTDLLEFTSEVGALLLGLGAGLAFSLDFLFELLDAGLQLLDLLVQLGNKGLFVLELGSDRGDLLVLALDGLLELLLVALEVGDGLLSQLEVSLSLPLGLLNVATVGRCTKFS